MDYDARRARQSLPYVGANLRAFRRRFSEPAPLSFAEEVCDVARHYPDAPCPPVAPPSRAAVSALPAMLRRLARPAPRFATRLPDAPALAHPALQPRLDVVELHSGYFTVAPGVYFVAPHPVSSADYCKDAVGAADDDADEAAIEVTTPGAAAAALAAAAASASSSAVTCSAPVAATTATTPKGAFLFGPTPADAVSIHCAAVAAARCATQSADAADADTAAVASAPSSSLSRMSRRRRRARAQAPAPPLVAVPATQGCPVPARVRAPRPRAGPRADAAPPLATSAAALFPAATAADARTAPAVAGAGEMRLPKLPGARGGPRPLVLGGRLAAYGATAAPGAAYAIMGGAGDELPAESAHAAAAAPPRPRLCRRRGALGRGPLTALAAIVSSVLALTRSAGTAAGKRPPAATRAGEVAAAAAVAAPASAASHSAAGWRRRLVRSLRATTQIRFPAQPTAAVVTVPRSVPGCNALKESTSGSSGGLVAAPVRGANVRDASLRGVPSFCSGGQAALAAALTSGDVVAAARLLLLQHRPHSPQAPAAAFPVATAVLRRRARLLLHQLSLRCARAAPPLGAPAAARHSLLWVSPPGAESAAEPTACRLLEILANADLAERLCAAGAPVAPAAPAAPAAGVASFFAASNEADGARFAFLAATAPAQRPRPRPKQQLQQLQLQQQLQQQLQMPALNPGPSVLPPGALAAAPAATTRARTRFPLTASLAAAAVSAAVSVAANAAAAPEPMSPSSAALAAEAAAAAAAHAFPPTAEEVAAATAAAAAAAATERALLRTTWALAADAPAAFTDLAAAGALPFPAPAPDALPQQPCASAVCESSASTVTVAAPMTAFAAPAVASVDWPALPTVTALMLANANALFTPENRCNSSVTSFGASVCASAEGDAAAVLALVAEITVAARAVTAAFARAAATLLRAAAREAHYRPSAAHRAAQAATGHSGSGSGSGGAHVAVAGVAGTDGALFCVPTVTLDLTAALAAATASDAAITAAGASHSGGVKAAHVAALAAVAAAAPDVSARMCKSATTAAAAQSPLGGPVTAGVHDVAAVTAARALAQGHPLLLAPLAAWAEATHARPPAASASAPAASAPALPARWLPLLAAVYGLALLPASPPAAQGFSGPSGASGWVAVALTAALPRAFPSAPFATLPLSATISATVSAAVQADAPSAVAVSTAVAAPASSPVTPAAASAVAAALRALSAAAGARADAGSDPFAVLPSEAAEAPWLGVSTGFEPAGVRARALLAALTQRADAAVKQAAASARAARRAAVLAAGTDLTAVREGEGSGDEDEDGDDDYEDDDEGDDCGYSLPLLTAPGAGPLKALQALQTIKPFASSSLSSLSNSKSHSLSLSLTVPSALQRPLTASERARVRARVRARARIRRSRVLAPVRRALLEWVSAMRTAKRDASAEAAVTTDALPELVLLRNSSIAAGTAASTAAATATAAAPALAAAMSAVGAALTPAAAALLSAIGARDAAAALRSAKDRAAAAASAELSDRAAAAVYLTLPAMPAADPAAAAAVALSAQAQLLLVARQRRRALVDAKQRAGRLRAYVMHENFLVSARTVELARYAASVDSLARSAVAAAATAAASAVATLGADAVAAAGGGSGPATALRAVAASVRDLLPSYLNAYASKRSTDDDSDVDSDDESPRALRPRPPGLRCLERMPLPGDMPLTYELALAMNPPPRPTGARLSVPGAAPAYASTSASLPQSLSQSSLADSQIQPIPLPLPMPLPSLLSPSPSLAVPPPLSPTPPSALSSALPSQADPSAARFDRCGTLSDVDDCPDSTANATPALAPALATTTGARATAAASALTTLSLSLDDVTRSAGDAGAAAAAQREADRDYARALAVAMGPVSHGDSCDGSRAVAPDSPLGGLFAPLSRSWSLSPPALVTPPASSVSHLSSLAHSPSVSYAASSASSSPGTVLFIGLGEHDAAAAATASASASAVVTANPAPQDDCDAGVRLGDSACRAAAEESAPSVRLASVGSDAATHSAGSTASGGGDGGSGGAGSVAAAVVTAALTGLATALSEPEPAAAEEQRDHVHELTLHHQRPRAPSLFSEPSPMSPPVRAPSSSVCGLAHGLDPLSLSLSPSLSRVPSSPTASASPPADAASLQHFHPQQLQLGGLSFGPTFAPAVAGAAIGSATASPAAATARTFAADGGDARGDSARAPTAAATSATTESLAALSLARTLFGNPDAAPALSTASLLAAPAGSPRQSQSADAALAAPGFPAPHSGELPPPPGLHTGGSFGDAPRPPCPAHSDASGQASTSYPVSSGSYPAFPGAGGALPPVPGSVAASRGAAGAAFVDLDEHTTGQMLPTSASASAAAAVFGLAPGANIYGDGSTAVAGPADDDDDDAADADEEDYDVEAMLYKLWDDWCPFTAVTQNELAPYLAHARADRRMRALITAYAVTPAELEQWLRAGLRLLTTRALRRAAQERFEQQAASAATAADRAAVARTATLPVVVAAAGAAAAALQDRADNEATLRLRVAAASVIGSSALDTEALALDGLRATLLAVTLPARGDLLAPGRDEVGAYWRPAAPAALTVTARAMRRVAAAVAAAVNVAVDAYGYWSDERLLFISSVQAFFNKTIGLLSRPTLPREAFL